MTHNAPSKCHPQDAKEGIPTRRSQRLWDGVEELRRVEVDIASMGNWQHRYLSRSEVRSGKKDHGV